MNQGDFLLTSAELALALLGFAGIVTVLQDRSNRDRVPGARLRFTSMISGGFGVLFFSLLPVPWVEGGASEFEWRVFNGLLVAALIVYNGVGLQILFSPQRTSGRSLPIASLIAVGNAVALLTVAFSLFGRGFEPDLGAYAFGLCWLVIFTSIFFVRLVFHALVADGEDGGA